ncbi:PLP-dependent transferase [Sporosarcina cascadiensis]|uniref:PLP-dependent transferase n=1 Tax=Sporosarcina cascadiensis TaxID=2660747 RepID=UPI00129A7B2B|nr:PLP-dependent transferase [Sporosarcina cascadiensis]
MTPLLREPLTMGVNVVVHSGTKYLKGYGDMIAGFVIGEKEEIAMIRKKLMGDLPIAEGNEDASD